MNLQRPLALLACLAVMPQPAIAEGADEAREFCPPHVPPPLLHPAGADDETVRMSADTASTQDGVYTLNGNAIVSRGQRQLRGDTLIYNRTESSAEAIGNVEFVSPDLVISGSRGKVFTETGSGTLEDIEYSLPGQHGRGTAREIRLDDREHQHLEQTGYTTCPPGNRDWLLYADEVTLDHTDGTGTAEHARFSLRGVPVLYTPWITFPIDDRRKTGMLVPRFGHPRKAATRSAHRFTGTWRRTTTRPSRPA